MVAEIDQPLSRCIVQLHAQVWANVDMRPTKQTVQACHWRRDPFDLQVCTVGVPCKEGVNDGYLRGHEYPTKCNAVS
jgi:hypothetical protein